MTVGLRITKCLALHTQASWALPREVLDACCAQLAALFSHAADCLHDQPEPSRGAQKRALALLGAAGSGLDAWDGAGKQDAGSPDSLQESLAKLLHEFSCKVASMSGLPLPAWPAGRAVVAAPDSDAGRSPKAQVSGGAYQATSIYTGSPGACRGCRREMCQQCVGTGVAIRPACL